MTSSGEEEILIIPPFIEGYPVKEIGSPSRVGLGHGKLEKVYILDTVERIYNSALVFSSRYNEIVVLFTKWLYFRENWVKQSNFIYATKEFYLDLIKGWLEYENGVERIGMYAFSDIRRLTEVIIPGSVKDIGEGAFRDCINLARLDIANGVTCVGKLAFASCIKLTSVYIPVSVQEIGFGIFNRCNNLTKITLPFIGEFSTPWGATNVGYVFSDEYFGNNSWCPESLDMVVIRGGKPQMRMIKIYE